VPSHYEKLGAAKAYELGKSDKFGRKVKAVFHVFRFVYLWAAAIPGSPCEGELSAERSEDD
jgi:hypothetical protein